MTGPGNGTGNGVREGVDRFRVAAVDADATDPGLGEELTEAEFLARYDMRAFDPVAVTVDVVVLTIRQGRLSVLLVRRRGHPFQGSWALPGGFAAADEDLDDAARRELAEEAGLALDDVADAAHVEQLKTYGTPGRDPRGHVVTVAYVAFLPDLPLPTAGDDAADARFWPIEDLADVELAFDHDRIIADGVERARAKIEYTTHAAAFCPEPFTIADLRRTYEAVWGVEVHQGNFWRKVRGVDGFLVPTGEKAAGGRKGAPADLYTRGPAQWLLPPLLRPEPTDHDDHGTDR